MVTVTGYEQRKNAQGESFISLLLQGDLELVKSQQSGRFYATARKISIPSTFNEQTAKAMVGRQMPGVITKVETEPYQYVTKDGEVLTLNHTYNYNPNPSNLEENVFEGKPVM